MMDPQTEQFLGYLITRDTRACVDVAVALADEGFSIPEVLTGMVAPAMVEVGDRWLRNELTVADEHAATAIADTVVSVLTATGPHTSAAPPVVTVACAEGEWHTMPPRLLAGVLRSEGFEVTFLGPSMPPTHLAKFLERSRPDVLGISCSTPLAFAGVISCVGVAHAAGIPVLAGGRALGSDDRRARVLGVDLWAPSAPAAAELLRQQLPAALLDPSADVDAADHLLSETDNLVAAAMDDLSRRFGFMARFDDFQRARTSEDFAFIVQFAAAAILTRDPRLFDDFLAWLDTLLSARGLPPGTVGVSLDAIRAAGPPASLVELLDGARAPSPTAVS
jgi:methanogenic corrinoid protein MtbC1